MSYSLIIASLCTLLYSTVSPTGNESRKAKPGEFKVLYSVHATVVGGAEEAYGSNANTAYIFEIKKDEHTVLKSVTVGNRIFEIDSTDQTHFQLRLDEIYDGGRGKVRIHTTFLSAPPDRKPKNPGKAAPGKEVVFNLKRKGKSLHYTLTQYDYLNHRNAP